MHARRYTNELKKFALTLHYHSPKAYAYCRTIMMLPHPSSLRHWTSTVNVNPGFLSEVLQALEQVPCEDKDCILIYDGMSIRQQICWSEVDHRYIGYCDYGNDFNIEGNEIEAKEVLAFIVVSLKGKWKWPIAYFLKHGMLSTTLAELIKTALILTNEVKLRVRAITWDGENTNISALNKLGCNVFPENYEDIKNFFTHPVENRNVFITLDACHMIKLGRNALADYGEFQCDDKAIKWEYIVHLHTLQKKLTFKFKNKLNSQCIYWKQNKIKVKYAANTLSASVANAIDFLRQEGLNDFKNSESTVKFIRIIDRLFDFLNSRNPFGKHFKQPITIYNFHYLQAMVQESIEYLFSLKCKDGTFLKKLGRKTFFYGIAIAAKSVLSISQDLLFSSNTSYKYVLSYKFSQDHIELLFAKIRSYNGHNNNPNALQFQHIMKKILLRNSIKNSNATNCLELDSDPVGSVFDFYWKKKKREALLYDDTAEIEDENDKNNNNIITLYNIQELEDNILYYISGYIVKQLKHINCYSCAESLLQNNYIEHNYVYLEYFSKFLDYNNNGGLIRPSKSVYKIILETERQIKQVTNNFENLTIKNLNLKIITYVKNVLTLDNFIFSDLNCENTDPLEIPHKIRLITAIAHRYLKLRLYSYSKFYTQEILKPVKKRHRLTKQILFLCK